MNYLKPALRDDYEYIVRTYHPNEFKENNCLSESDVLKAHYILSDFFLDKGEEVRFGILNYDMLASAVHRQYVEYAGVRKWNDPFHLMATLVFGLTKDHAFHDGNKRTALLCLLLGLNMNKRELNVKKSFLELLMVRIASNGLEEYKDFKRFKDTDDPEVNFIAQMIRNWTRARNTRLYTITFAELNTNLSKFNVFLDKPSGNMIDVFKEVEKSSLFSNQKKTIRKRICQIGFPGWKKQIGDHELKKLLAKVGLDAQHGYDSDVFFNGAVPTYELLEEYKGPLERLKDK